MHCAKCGSPNPDNATVCSACGATLSNPYAAPTTFSGTGEKINNWLIPAIFSVLCCCPLFGIVSIVFAAQVNGKLASGDVAGAHAAAKSAKMWFWVSFGIGFVLWALYLGLLLIGGIAAAVQEQQMQQGM